MTLANLRVIVDADACPKNCLKIIEELSGLYHYEVVTVASFDHQINSPIIIS